jgi:hypothetical protein
MCNPFVRTDVLRAKHDLWTYVTPQRGLNGSFTCHNVSDCPLEPTLDPSADGRAEARVGPGVTR